MADSKQALRKPTFTKVGQLRPGTSGHTLTVKVVSTKMVLQKGRADGPQVRQMRISECLVGDETGMIIFTARNDQGESVIMTLMYVLSYYICRACLTSSFHSHVVQNYLLLYYSFHKYFLSNSINRALVGC